MKLFVLVVASVLALANADVSHLLNADHHHHHHHDHQQQPHAGYSYDEPSVPFELPKATYLPPEVPTTPKAAYLPPEQPASTYLPPKTTRAPPPPPPPRTTRAPLPPPPPPPPPAPKNEYLPPQEQESQHFEIPLPSYADSFLEPDSPHLAAASAVQPEAAYLPPTEQVEERSADGYHYDAPAKRFRF